MKTIKFILILAFMSLHVSAHAGKVVEQTTIQTIDGEKIQVERMPDGLVFKGYEDKIVLLEAFGHSCPPCKASIPGYNRLQKKYQKDIVIFAIEVWGSDNSGLKRYAQQHGIQYKTISKASSGKIIKFMQNMTGWVPGLGVPYLMLFNKGGVLTKDVTPQSLPEAHVNNLIKGLL